MPARADAALESFLESQDASTLVSLLLELADEHAAVRERLSRLQLASRPAKLAAVFRKNLSAWRRSRRFVAYAEARAFGRELEGWLDQVERELLPRDPPATVALAEAFVESDASFFERADDSDGAVGSAIAAACRLWLRAAARCESPPDEWPARIRRLVSEDDYGARAELLREAATLLDEQGLRTLAGFFEQEQRDALARRTGSKDLPTEVFPASGALGLLSDALGDPDLRVRSVLAYSPQPNPLQVQEFVGAYLRHGRPADALPWLDGASWQVHEGARRYLLAQALRGLGRRAESAAIRRQLFEASLDVTDLREWLDDLPPTEQPAATSAAREMALRSDRPVAAATLLLELGEDERAEDILIQGEGGVRQRDYTELVPLVRELDRRELWRGATCVYRALLDGLLARAYSPAYTHGAKYWLRLQAIAERGVDLSPLTPHVAYAEQVRQQHARKAGFWRCVAQAQGG